MRRIERYKFFFHLRGTARRSRVLRNFLFATEKGHETAVSHSLGFPASIRSDPPGISEYVCIEARHLFHPPCRNPEGRRSRGFSLGSVEWPAWQDTAQRKTFIYHPPRKQGRRPCRRRNAPSKKGAEGLFLRRE